jgi:hypothetical protein
MAVIILSNEILYNFMGRLHRFQGPATSISRTEVYSAEAGSRSLPKRRQYQTTYYIQG